MQQRDDGIERRDLIELSRVVGDAMIMLIVESLALFLIMSMVSGLGCQRRKVALWEGRRQWASKFTPLVSVANFRLGGVEGSGGRG